MKRFLSNTTTLLIFLTCIMVPVFGQRASNCSTNLDLVGYSTIQDINLDMQDVQDECVFDGGSVQVMIGDIPTNVTFEGLTFRNFNETSIRAFAPKDSVVEFANCIWTNFSSNFSISISAENGTETAMNATLRDCVILNGQAVSLISNDGGFLEMINMTISNVRAVGLVVTGKEGNTTVETLVVSKCNVDYVTFGTGNSSVDVRDADIFENTNLGGTKTTVGSSKIRNNLIERTTGQDGWSAVYANDTSTADVGRIEISGNTNMQYGVASAEYSTAFVTSSNISNNTGLVVVRNTISVMTMFDALRVLTGDHQHLHLKGNSSAPIFARNVSFISVNNTILLGNVNFLFSIFAVFRSSVTVETTCIIGGSSLTATMFVGQESNFSVVGNFIKDHNSSGCPEGGPRLFKESEGASCFQGNGIPCNGTCMEMADAEMCLAGANSTLAPTPSPMPTPTTPSSPVVEPTNPPVTTSPATTKPSTLAPPSSPTSIPAPSPSPVVGLTTPPITTSPPIPEPSTLAPPSSPTSIPAPSSSPLVGPTTPPVTTSPRTTKPSTLAPPSSPTSIPAPSSSPVVGPTTPPVTTSPPTPEPSTLAPTSVPATSSSPVVRPTTPPVTNAPVIPAPPSSPVISSSPSSLSAPFAPSASEPTSKPVQKPAFRPLPGKGKGSSKKSKATKSTKGEKSRKGKGTKKHPKAKGHEHYYVHYPKSSKSKGTKKHSKSKGHYGYEYYERPKQTWYGRPSEYESPHMHTYKRNNKKVHTRPIIEQQPMRNLRPQK